MKIKLLKLLTNYISHNQFKMLRFHDNECIRGMVHGIKINEIKATKNKIGMLSKSFKIKAIGNSTSTAMTKNISKEQE